MQREDRAIHILRLYDLPLPDIQPLVLESRTEQHRFVDRLVDEYVSGSNRFALPGEALYAAYVGDTMVGVGGLNRDPFVIDSDSGRVRHLYVLKEWRGQDVGKVLMQQIVAEACNHFAVLTLRTFSPHAARFYDAIGFETVADVDAVTHRLLLDSETERAYMTHRPGKPDRLDEGIFDYRATKDGKVLITWHGKQVTILRGKAAQKFLARVDEVDERSAQLEMAKVTGHFKHGNER